MSERDTIRWGEVKVLDVTVPPGGLGPQFLGTNLSQQLIKAQSKRPVVWGLRIIIVPQFLAAENATFTITFKVTIGAGSNSMEIPFIYTLAPTAGVYVPITDFQQLPACEVNANVTVASTALGITAGDHETLNLGAFIAPITAFQGLERLFDSLDVPEEDRGRMRWMHGQPFQDDPLHYKR